MEKSDGGEIRWKRNLSKDEGKMFNETPKRGLCVGPDSCVEFWARWFPATHKKLVSGDKKIDEEEIIDATIEKVDGGGSATWLVDASTWQHEKCESHGLASEKPETEHINMESIVDGLHPWCRWGKTDVEEELRVLTSIWICQVCRHLASR